MTTPTPPLRAVEASLQEAVGDRLRRDEPLGARTTYRVGGRAALLLEANGDDDLVAARDALAAAGGAVPVVVVGNGSNLLVADAGFAGLAVVLGDAFAAVEIDGATVTAGAAALLPVVARRTAAAALTGFEWAVGVPGSIGGAVRMNAGAYGGEMQQVLGQALVLAPGRERRGGAGELGMRYRGSNVAPDEVVAEATLALRPGDRDEIRAIVREMQGRRRSAQPQKVRTFGSVWKNPTEQLGAGRLLERCGLKGYRIGGARISPVHANFIENVDGQASSADVIALMAEARCRARKEGVELEHEVQMLGPIALPED